MNDVLLICVIFSVDEQYDVVLLQQEQQSEQQEVAVVDALLERVL